jgi:drug/metabolite transporter (DMT)-like permease
LSNNLKKGLIFGFLGTLLVGLQPVIANSATSIDSHAFASMTCLVEALIFLPIMILEIKVNKQKNSKSINQVPEISLIKNVRKNLWLLVFIGIIFGINQLFFFIGYKLAGAINGALTQKTSVFFGLIFGYVLLKEKVSKLQIIFSIVLFFGLMIAITQGSIDFLSSNVNELSGVLIVLIITAMWMIGHTLTRPLLSKKDLTPIQMVFIRNILSGTILLITFLIFSPEDISVFFEPYNQFFFVLFGSIYSIGLFCWYKTLSYLDVSNATIVLSPTPIVTAIFATFLLGDVFTIFHLIGLAIVVVSILIIVKQNRD